MHLEKKHRLEPRRKKQRIDLTEVVKVPKNVDCHTPKKAEDETKRKRKKENVGRYQPISPAAKQQKSPARQSSRERNTLQKEEAIKVKVKHSPMSRRKNLHSEKVETPVKKKFKLIFEHFVRIDGEQGAASKGLETENKKDRPANWKHGTGLQI